MQRDDNQRKLIKFYGNLYKCVKGCDVLDGKTKEKRKKEAIAKNAQILSHKNYLILGHRGGAKSVGHLIFELHKSPINGVLFV